MSDSIVRKPVLRHHLIACRQGKLNCSHEGCRCREGLSSIDVDPGENVVRVPVTREGAILFLTGRITCTEPGCPCHEAATFYRDLLHDSIYRLVFEVMKRFPHLPDREDLKQQCLLRIMLKLPKFDPSKAQFSTWAWTVTENVLKRESVKCTRERRVFTELTVAHEAVIGSRDMPAFSQDMQEAISILKQENRAMVDVIDVIFFGGARAKNGNIIVAKLARETKRGYDEIQVFMNQVVRPFIAERFEYGEGKCPKTVN